MSLIEFKAVEYEGSKQVVASDEIKEQILKAGIRKVERTTGVSHHTISKILKDHTVRRKTLMKIEKQIFAQPDENHPANASKQIDGIFRCKEFSG